MNGGIAEQNTISLAAGMAMTGMKVCVYNIIPFLLYRTYEQVRNDICYQELPVILAGIGAGLSYAPAGMTHYSIEDLALTRSLPNLEVLSPADPQEAKACARYALECKNPIYIRLGKTGEPNLHPNSELQITEPLILKEGEDLTILFHGSIGEEVLKASQELSENQIEVQVISLPQVQPLNTDSLLAQIPPSQKILVVEEHQKTSGLGASLAQKVIQEKLDIDLEFLSIQDEFVHHIRDHSGMRQHYGIDAQGIKAAVLKIREEEIAFKR